MAEAVWNASVGKGPIRCLNSWDSLPSNTQEMWVNRIRRLIAFSVKVDGEDGPSSPLLDPQQSTSEWAPLTAQVLIDPARERFVVLGWPSDLVGDREELHNCDQMGCGSAGLHVLARGRFETHQEAEPDIEDDSDSWALQCEAAREQLGEVSDIGNVSDLPGELAGRNITQNEMEKWHADMEAKYGSGFVLTEAFHWPQRFLPSDLVSPQSENSDGPDSKVVELRFITCSGCGRRLSKGEPYANVRVPGGLEEAVCGDCMSSNRSST